MSAAVAQHRESGVQVAWLHGGGRLHLQHGPIDLIVQADGPQAAIDRAYRQAILRFDGVLQALVDELPALRRDVADGVHVHGDVAVAMASAARRLRKTGFASPMIAVAGAVADTIIASMCCHNAALTRASVNNGGDISLYLSPGTWFDIGLANDAAVALGNIRITALDPVRGIATSGWRGRSQSLGIADSVTVLAATAARADAAATVVANAVNLPLDSRSVERLPADQINPDSELAQRPVTVAVGPLGDCQIQCALEAGAQLASALCVRGEILGACLCLQGQYKMTGITALARLPSSYSQPESRQHA